MSQPEISRWGKASVVGQLTKMLAAADRFIEWWGAHRPWPANECPRIGDGSGKLPTDR